MRYPPALLDEIRTRLPVSAVVGRKVRLKKAGREWKGLSPFNTEKTPSFFVNDQKGFYHCFSSGQHGDVFTFLMETEGLTFPEAVERLAAEAGVPLPKMAAEGREAGERKQDLYEVLELACRFFENQLQTAKGQAARDYLTCREISSGTQTEFRLGFAPDGRSALLAHLRERGVTDAQAVTAGLAIRPDDGRPIYDRFRGRLMIPIQDLKGRIVAFGGRTLVADGQPKYLNSPETEVFKKGAMVFNAHRAREAAFKANTVTVVEGYLDAITAYQAGVQAIVATLGTAFTEEQIRALWRFAPEPVVCFDGDSAGRQAAFRAIDRILPALRTGNSFRFAFIPSGQDPDDLIREAGIERFKRVIDEALTLWDMIWSRETATADLSTPDGQAVLDKRVADLLSQISDPRLKRCYQARARVHLSDLFWRARPGQLNRSSARGRSATIGAPLIRSSDRLAGRSTRQVGLEHIFLGLCVEYPDLAERAHERIMHVRMRGSYKTERGESITHQQFLNQLVDHITAEPLSGSKDLHRQSKATFSEVMDFIHGHAIPGQAMGYRLRSRFKILSVRPPHDFIERCFFNFLAMLEMREMEDHLAELVELIGKSSFDVQAKAEEQLLRLQRELLQTRERTNAAELALAEEASGYRYPSGTAASEFGLAA